MASHSYVLGLSWQLTKQATFWAWLAIFFYNSVYSLAFYYILKVVYANPQATWKYNPQFTGMVSFLLGLIFQVAFYRFYHGKSPFFTTIWEEYVYDFFQASNKQIQDPWQIMGTH